MEFLVVEAERENAIDNLERVLIREARGLGVADRVMCHSASLTELARLGDCAGSPEGIDCNPNDVEQAMIDYFAGELKT